MATVSQLRAVLTLNTTKFQRSLGRLSQSIRTTALEFKKTGRQMTRWITLPMAAVGATAGTAATKMQDSMKKISGAVGATKKEMEAIESATERIAKTTGLAFDKISQAQEKAQSSQLSTEKANKLVADSAKLVASGFGDMQSSVEFSTSAMLKFGDEMDNTRQIMDTTIASAQAISLKMEQFIPNFQRSLTSMKRLGLSFEEGAAAFAGLADAAVSASAAGRQFRQFLKSLANPTEEMNELINDAFGSFQGLKEAMERDAIAAFKKLRQEMDKSNQTWQELLRRQAAVNGAANLFANNMERMKDVIRSQEDATGSLNRVFKKTDSFLRSLNKQWNKIKVALEPFGNEVMPIVIEEMKRFADTVDSASKAFASLDQETQEFMVSMAKLITLMGPAVLIIGQFALGLSRIGILLKKTAKLITWLAGVFGTLAVATGRVVSFQLFFWLQRVSGGATAAGAAMSGFAASALSLLGTIASVLVIAASLAEVAILIFENWNQLAIFFDNLTQDVQNVFFALSQLTISAFQAATEAITNLFRKMWKKVKVFAEPAIDFMIDLWLEAMEQMTIGARKLFRALASAATRISGDLALSLSGAADAFRQNENNLRRLQREGVGVQQTIADQMDILNDKVEFSTTFWTEKVTEWSKKAKKAAKEFGEDFAREFKKFGSIIVDSNERFFRRLKEQTKDFFAFFSDQRKKAFSPKLTRKQNALVTGDIAGALFETNKEREKRLKLVEQWQKEQKSARKEQEKLNNAVKNTSKKTKEARAISKKTFKKISSLGQSTATILRNEFASFSGAFSDELDKSEQRMAEFAAKSIESLIKIAKATEIVGQAQDVSGSGGTAGAVANIIGSVVSFFGDTPDVLKAQKGNLTAFKKGDFVAASQTKEGLQEQVMGGKRANKSIKKQKEKEGSGTTINMTTNVNVAMGVDAAAEAAIKRRIPDIQEAVESGIVKKLGSGGGKLHTAIKKTQ